MNTQVTSTTTNFVVSDLNDLLTLEATLRARLPYLKGEVNSNGKTERQPELECNRRMLAEVRRAIVAIREGK